MQQISFLKSLEKINFKIYNKFSSNDLSRLDIKCLKSFGNECKQLKKVRLTIDIPYEFRASEIFKSMSSFKQLNYLCLYLNRDSPQTLFEENRRYNQM